MPKRSLEDIDDNIYYGGTLPDVDIISNTYYPKKYEPNKFGNIIIGGLAPNPSFEGINFKRIKNIAKIAKNVISRRYPKQHIRNVLSKVGDGVIQSTTGSIIGDKTADKIYNDYLKEDITDDNLKKETLKHVAVRTLGSTLGILGGLSLSNLKTRNNFINDIIARPIETTIEISKHRYPFTQKQLLNNNILLKNNLIKKGDDIIRNLPNGSDILRSNKRYAVIPNSAQWYEPGEFGHFNPNTNIISLNTTISKHSNLPPSYNMRLGNVEDVFNHELQHYIHELYPNTKYAETYGSLVTKLTDKGKNKVFNPLYNRYKHPWLENPNEFDAELSFVQSALGKNYLDTSNKIGIGYLSNRFEIKDTEAKKIVDYMLNNRKLLNTSYRKNRMNIFK